MIECNHMRQCLYGQERATYLAEFGSTSLPIPTKDPSITKTRSIFPSTHRFTRITTFFRSIKLKLRTPFHSWTPKLQIFNPSTTPSNILLTNQIQRWPNIPKLRNRTTSCYCREENIDQTARNKTHKKKNQTV